MKRNVWRLPLWLAAVLLGLGFQAAEDEAPDLSKLVGLSIGIELTDGKSVAEAEVTKVSAAGQGVKSITYKTGPKGKLQTAQGAKVRELYLDGQPLDVEFNKKAKALVHNPEKRTQRLAWEKETNERLRTSGNRLWEHTTPAVQEEYLAKHKDHLKEVAEKFPNVQFRMKETNYYLFFTDMPEQHVVVYLNYLDAMYDELCKAFGVPLGKSIFRGKCVVIAFTNFQLFSVYEQTFQDYVPREDVQGLCHNYPDGDVVVSMWQGRDPVYFATVLVHESAHGFVHRYKSSARIPPWMNEGISDWVAAAIVKADKEVKRRQTSIAARLRQTGAVNPLFFRENVMFSADEYGLASSLVELMLQIDNKKYKEMFDHIKEGYSTPEAMQKAYGMSYEDLISRYGQAIGRPDLK